MWWDFLYCMSLGIARVFWENIDTLFLWWPLAVCHCWRWEDRLGEAQVQTLRNTLRINAALHCLAQRGRDASKKCESKMSGIIVGKRSYWTPIVFSTILSALEKDISLPPTCKTTNFPYISEVWTWKFKWVNSCNVKLLRL